MDSLQMLDTSAEMVCAVIVFILLIQLYRLQKRSQLLRFHGWWYFMVGFILLFTGRIIDFAENIPELTHYLIFGDNIYRIFLEEIIGSLIGFVLITYGICNWIPIIIDSENRKNMELKRMKSLTKRLPVCVNCHNVRDDEGYWNEVHEYIENYSDNEVSHSICPGCLQRDFPGL